LAITDATNGSERVNDLVNRSPHAIYQNTSPSPHTPIALPVVRIYSHFWRVANQRNAIVPLKRWWPRACGDALVGSAWARVNQ